MIGKKLRHYQITTRVAEGLLARPFRPKIRSAAGMSPSRGHGRRYSTWILVKQQACGGKV